MMGVDEIEKESRFTLTEAGKNGWRVTTPFTYRDGDVIHFALLLPDEESFYISDGGGVLFHFATMGVDFDDTHIFRSQRFLKEFYPEITLEKGMLEYRGKGNPAFAIPDYTAAILALELKWREWFGFFN